MFVTSMHVNIQLIVKNTVVHNQGRKKEWGAADNMMGRQNRHYNGRYKSES